MAESVRKRKSKWDIVAETRIPTEIVQDNALPVKVDDPVKEQESNSDWDSSQSNWSDMRTDYTMLYKDSSEAYQSSKWPGLEEDTKVAEDDPGKPQFPKCSDIKAGNADGSKRSFWEPMSGNQTTAKDGNMSQSPKHSDVEAGDRDVSMTSEWEPISGDKTTLNDGSISDGCGNQTTKKDGSEMDLLGRQDCPGKPHFTKCSNVEAGNADGSQSPKHPDVEAGDKYVSNRSEWEPISGNQTTANDGSITDVWENQTTKKDGSDADGWGRQDTTKVGWATDGRGRQDTSKEGWATGEWGTSVKNYRKSVSPGLDARRQHGRSNSPRSVRSRSYRSRSRSPSHGFKHESQRWPDRGRMGACRDFAAGRCRRGSQCRFVHEDGGKYERGRYSGPDSKENFTDSREQRDYSRDRNSTELCNNFTRGKCYRGSSCRYSHDNASSDTRERNRDRRDADSSFGRRPEPRRTSDIPCKYFAEGRCYRGEACKFSHQGVSHGSSDFRPQDDKMDYSVETDYSSSRTRLNLGDQTSAMDQTEPSPWVADKINSGASQEQNTTQEASGQYPRVPAISTQVMAQNANSQQHHGSREGGSREGGKMVASSATSQAEMDPVNTVAAIPGQHFVQSGPNQCVPQSLPVQNFAPTVQLQQGVPPLPFNGQIHQGYPLPPSNGLSQFVAPHAPPNTQIFNLGSQSQPVFNPPHNVQSQQNFNRGGQVQQNFPGPQNGPNQQNYNLGGQAQGLPPPHHAHNQPNFPHIGQIQQGHPLPYNGQNQQNINISGQGQQIHHLPQSGQVQQIIHPVGPNGQSHYGPPQPVPSPQSFNSGTQGHQMISQHGVNDSLQKPGMTEIKPSQLSTDASIANKVVTSEQAAQITNLTTSLAQFFGNGPQLPQLYAALNPETATGEAPLQPFLNPGAARPLAPAPAPAPAPAAATHPQPSQVSLTQQQHDPISDDTSNVPPGFSSVNVEQKDPKPEEPPMVVKGGSTPLSTTGEPKVGNQENPEPKQIEVELSGGTASKEVKETKTGQSKKEHTAQSEDDGESKRSKDGKGSRMFKCALVEFVKDALKPAWKEGHLSKEVHKTIVKKVVDKVTGAMQTSNIPQTQEKIDIYMAYSKGKLNKLVQAYLEKYV